MYEFAPERLNGINSYSVFKSLSVIGQCPVNMNIPASKTWVLQLSPQNKKLAFF
jgi:hypothetical protein